MAGKGGTGKTTIAALIIRIIKEKGLGSILAVDADPNSNLCEVLGLAPKESVGEILDNIATGVRKIPSGMSKDRFIEYEVQSAIVESDGFDVLTMGRPEGPGCYCYVNNVLRGVVSKLINDYDYIVIDNEAGLEHLSRRTTRSANALVIVSGPTSIGLKSAKRISDLTKDLAIKINKELLLINCSQENIEKQRLKDFTADYLGSVPLDEEIAKISQNGSSIMDLNQDAVSLNTLRKLGDKIWQRN